MPKIKAPRSSPSLDMTPMVDLFFLLVTFFMLTATFRNEEPVMVDTPRSTSDKILPDNTMLFTIDTAGRVFYTIDGQEVRKNLITDLGKQYNVKFSDDQITTFSKMTSVGLPVAELPAYISLKADKRKAIDKAVFRWIQR
jgi:biopolymer transport protein ExbD